jgi:hypothetical protein
MESLLLFRSALSSPKMCLFIPALCVPRFYPTKLLFAKLPLERVGLLFFRRLALFGSEARLVSGRQFRSSKCCWPLHSDPSGNS